MAESLFDEFESHHRNVITHPNNKKKNYQHLSRTPKNLKWIFNEFSLWFFRFWFWEKFFFSFDIFPTWLDQPVRCCVRDDFLQSENWERKYTSFDRETNGDVMIIKKMFRDVKWEFFTVFFFIFKPLRDTWDEIFFRRYFPPHNRTKLLTTGRRFRVKAKTHMKSRRQAQCKYLDVRIIDFILTHLRKILIKII